MRSRKGKKARTGAAPRRSGAAAAAAPRSLEHDPSALYGLYSTGSDDFCSGAWYPISYVGPAPPAENGAAAAAAAAAAGGDACLPLADSDLLVRWHSTSSHYDPERLSVAFVRHGSEFSSLPLDHQKVGKRVLVRDLLEASDFQGVSFWLATIKSEPVQPAQVGRKRAAGGATVEVEYQNTLWPATSVPASSIFVLPKQKCALNLVPEVETDELQERRRQWMLQQEQTERHANQPAAAAAAAAASSATLSLEEEHKGDSSALSASLVPGSDDVAAAAAASSASPLPFAFSVPAGGVDLDAHLQLSPFSTPGRQSGPFDAELEVHAATHAGNLTDSDPEID